MQFYVLDRENQKMSKYLLPSYFTLIPIPILLHYIPFNILYHFLN